MKLYELYKFILKKNGKNTITITTAAAASKNYNTKLRKYNNCSSYYYFKTIMNLFNFFFYEFKL